MEFISELNEKRKKVIAEAGAGMNTENARLSCQNENS